MEINQFLSLDSVSSAKLLIVQIDLESFYDNPSKILFLKQTVNKKWETQLKQGNF